MRVMMLVGMSCILACQIAVAQPTTRITSCPMLNPGEAAAILGPEASFLGGGETVTAQKVRTNLVCDYSGGERRLQLTISPTIGDRKAWESLRSFIQGSLEAGLGDYAYSVFKDGEASFLIVKGAHTMGLSLRGKGVTAADIAKLRDTAKKVVPRL